MPTYAYACTECGHRFDAVQSFTDDALTTCPECRGRLRKVFDSVGVVFKGSGFYRTDSRNQGGSGGSTGSSSGADTSTGSASTTNSSSSGSSGSSTASGSSGSSGGTASSSSPSTT